MPANNVKKRQKFLSTNAWVDKFHECNQPPDLESRTGAMLAK